MRQRINFHDIPAKIQVSRFHGSAGTTEAHLLIQPELTGDLNDQLEVIAKAYARAIEAIGLKMNSAVWRRFFLSDPSNQYAFLEGHPLASKDAACAVSLLGQMPQGGEKVALLAYHISDVGEEGEKFSEKRYELQRGQLRHQWCTKFSSPSEASVHAQTVSVYDQYIDALKTMDGTLLNHAVRTWIYVRDVDYNYAGVVSGRNEVFAREGLTPDSHYIASTGIEARFGKIDARVFMDTYSIGGLLPEQVEYLHAEDYLGRTDAYGVCFERATVIHYRDRKHIFVSGTASIGPDGEIIHPYDVLAQLDRAMENVCGLLKSADARLEDMVHWIVYVRDPGDAQRVQAALSRTLGEDVPVMLVYGAVCRQGWLVEVEGMAIVEHSAEKLPVF